MLFNSYQFLLFFPCVVLLYYALPKKVRYIWLLIASYFFYMCWNPGYILLILASTVITYLSGIFMEKIKKSSLSADKIKKYNKLVLIASLCINLGILCYFKYTNFFLESISNIFALMNIELNIHTFDILLPVGISFYTFQALGYSIDVYRDEIYAEKNFFRYALFVSFFPQLVAGPIERSKNLLKQLAEPKKIDFEGARSGFLLMLWGYFMKLVIADRAAIFVDTVYGDYANYSGVFLIIATLFFSIQIYCDFAGYSLIATGAARILGVDLMENFDAPYLSTSVADFWRRWHISLTSWFKDYLYIPLGGSRKGKFRKYLNKMIVFLVSGLWHGASWSFVVWGGLNGLYQVIGEILLPIRDRIAKFCHIKADLWLVRLIKILITYVLVSFAWIFFRADNIKQANEIAGSIFTKLDFSIFSTGAVYECGLDVKNFKLLIIAILVLLFTDICKRKGFVIRDFMMRRFVLIRSIFIAASILTILLFGKYGASLDKASFIYFQF
ncbi:MAG: MBOAT family protein [Lachnospiraceae bacterium]|nr:MBOAT family protein [Lachnospiraceae bacterium]